ncbi:hypothetical protein BGX27_001265 [Mortierella sp. AM989]|nr:hypothetical protein BGX27_001265 [Mortierella sp. AM989]
MLHINTLLTLFCLVDGEDSPFPVKIESTESIGGLKKAIKAEIPDTFNGVDAKDLTLWRVSIPVLEDDDDEELPILLDNVSKADKKKLKATSELSDIFEETLPKKTIHIIVQRASPRPSVHSTSSAGMVSMHLLGNRPYQKPFPKMDLGLPYRAPEPLLRTTGLNWMYQPDPELYGSLQREIKAHHHDFFSGQRDKSTIPMYLFLCGAGTGKSRNAQEFHRSAVYCLAEEDRELRNKIEHAWVFHISLENGTSPLSKEVDPIEAIGKRMLLQLLPNKRLRDVMTAYQEVHPMEVLELVAKGVNQDLRSATIILVVDGLQSFLMDPNDGQNKDSVFYKALTNIGDLALEDVFLMACCTATVTSPVDKALASTHRKRVVLPVAKLQPPRICRDGLAVPVFDEDDHIIKVLVGDCGGHGRALESLLRACEEAGEDYNVDLLMNKLYLQLKDLYSEAILLLSSTAQAMARAILTRAILDPDKPLPETNKLPGELAIPGLIRYEQPDGLGTAGYLTAPYIWVWLFSYQPKEGADPILSNWRFCDYQDIKSKMDPRSPPGAQFWQHFEHFVATFRCLKSRVLSEGEHTTISAIHTGARLNGDISFRNHHLRSAISSKHVDTKSTSHSLFSSFPCEHGTLSVRKSDYCIINAPSAPFGDSFLGLDTKKFCTEVHQCKLIADGGRIDYQAERDKAASAKDFFLLFSSSDHFDVTLPPRSGIVDMSNWEHYFGPFAGRAFVFASTGALDINLAVRKDLKRMRGVGDKKADLIIQERAKRRFDSYEDASDRLRGMGETVLRTFKFPKTA